MASTVAGTGIASPVTASSPLYARFSRRLRGLFIDWTISLVVMFGALMIASSLRNDDVSRALGIGVVLFVLLYEPVLVSMTGSTIGHRMTNMRVVDDAHGGNVSFLKAVARFVIKNLIGLYSFVAMATTRRNQTVHDLLTKSTVQMRDASKARAGEFVSEQIELASSNMPPWWRRLLVIVAYAFVAFWILYAVLIAISAVAPDMLSMRCVLEDICTKQEDRVANVAGLAMILCWIALFILGWRGKLCGARKSV